MVLKVPPPGKGALYIRPLLIGSGAILGVAPAPEYTFLIYASPVGDYHKVSLCCVLLTVIMNIHSSKLCLKTICVFGFLAGKLRSEP